MVMHQFIIRQRDLHPKLINKNILLEQSGQAVEPYFYIDMPPIMGVMSALVFAFVLGIGLSKVRNSTLLKSMEDFSSVILMVVTNALIPLVPIYIGCVFAKLSFSGEIFSTMKSFGIVYLILFSLQIIYILIQYSIAAGIKKKILFHL